MITEIEPTLAKAWLDKGEAVLIDVREQSEYEAEAIPGSELHPLSVFDPATIAPIQKVIFHCRSGRRSHEAAARWSKLHHTPAYNLKGGIEGWKKAGLPIF